MNTGINPIICALKMSLLVFNYDNPTELEEGLRWLKTVSSTCIRMGHYDHSLTLDATIMVSKNYPIIGEHVAIIFLTQ